MREHDKGFITREIHLTKQRFRQAHRLTKENSWRELCQLLTRHYTYFPRITWHEIDEIIDWRESEARREGYAVKAIIRVACGHRLLADFLRIHDHGAGNFIQMTNDADGVFLTCACQATLDLDHDSLKGMYKDDEINERLRRRGEARAGTPASIVETD